METCEICSNAIIDIVVKAKKSSDDDYEEWWFNTSPVVGLNYCPMCGRKL